MAHDTLPRPRVELSLKDMTDPERHALAAGVAKLAPTSALYTGNTSIQASVAALAKKDATLTLNNAAVAYDKKQLTADTDAETITRGTFDAELSNLATLTGNAALTPADISGMSFKPYARPPVASGPPPVPTGIDVKIPRTGRGAAGIAVQQPAGAKWSFVVEWSPNPPTATSWALLTGNGKTRGLTGASGTQMWVRAARVRRQLQSDWCTPVLVTIP